ncbi:MAG: HEAT repeat domain-containing protein [Cyanobacteria bacterium P01_G01_bin.49]
MNINWREVGRVMLKDALPINPMNTQPEEMGMNGEDLQIVAEMVNVSNQSSCLDYSRSGSKFSDDSTSAIVKDNIYTVDRLLTETISSIKDESDEQKIAIIGESGTGKTLILQKIAHWMLEKTNKIPIWISPHQLKTLTIEKYLWSKWLVKASNRCLSTEITITETMWKKAFGELLNSGKVWLLLDGIDYRLTKKVVDNPKQSCLESFLNQRQDLANKIHVILTCQTRTWKAATSSLSKVEVYQTQLLQEDKQIQQFIQQWFHSNIRLSQSNRAGDIADKLCYILRKPENQHFQQWFQNPWRLTLQCRLWHQDPNRLPSSSFQLYQGLVNQVYQWQGENVTITSQQKEQLIQWLASLAWKNQQITQGLSALSQAIARETVEENRDLLSLAVQLKWLHRVGIVTENGSDDYVFGDRTFQDYFAASAIDDWQCFFNDHQTPNVLLSDSWQRILKFWLGRQEIAPQQKDALIKALIAFEDGCDPYNFYGFRTYLIAASCLSEFPECCFAQAIAQQLLKWALLEDQAAQLSLQALAARKALSNLYRPLAVSTLLDFIDQNQDEWLQKQALQMLGQLAKNNEIAIAALSRSLEAVSSPSLNWQIAETLGTIDPGNPQAIAIFVNLVQQATSDETRKIAFMGLEKIARGTLQGIKALVKLLYHQPSPLVQRHIFQCLETIGQGNATAIAILVQLMRTTQDPEIQRQGAESLEKIDPGNPTALNVLVKLTVATSPEVIRQKAVYSLGEVTPGNQQGIRALVDLLRETDNIYIRWIAISSLGKIGLDSQSASAALATLINSDEPLLLKKEALDNLNKINPQHPAIIQGSIDLIQGMKDEATHREIAENLGKLDAGNPEAIKALTQILRTSTDEFIRRRAAASLGQIDVGNLNALNTLIYLVQSTQDADIRSLAAESLGEIGGGNPAAIATLIRLLKTSPDLESCRSGAKSLSQIAPGNKEAIAILVKQLQKTTDSILGRQIAESLTTMISQTQMSQVIIQLRDYLLQDPYPESSPYYQIMWHCAQSLPHREFYQAWHQRKLPTLTVSNRIRESVGE